MKSFSEELYEKFRSLSDEEQRQVIEGSVCLDQIIEKSQDEMAQESSLEQMVDQLKQRFTTAELLQLNYVGCSPEQALQYDERLDGWTILTLFKQGYMPEKVNKYGQRFKGWEILKLIEAKCSPQKADKYTQRFNGGEIVKLVKAKCSPQKAMQYNPRFSADEIIRLFKAGCNSKKAEEYDQRFNGTDIGDVVDAGILPKLANLYPSGLSGREIRRLVGEGSPPEKAKQSNKNLTGEEISILSRIGININEISPSQQERLSVLFKELVGYKEIQLSSEEFKLIGTGSSSVVLLKNNHAWKFSQNVCREYELLKRIREMYYPGYPANIIQLYGEPRERIVIELEHIRGDTLENLLKKQVSLTPKQIIKYASDIMTGIIQLRLVGIYHRDIHNRNVMIDEKNDRAVIIDFDVATYNPEEIHPLNRAYGGNNDLISLGQLMYKMATGHNLFNEESGFSCYSAIKQGIKTEREKAYDNPDLKQEYFNKVRQNIKSKGLANKIINLLNDDLWTQPSMKQVGDQAETVFGIIIR